MDIVTLALAKKYTEETAISFGAVKGAPCMVSGSSKDSDGNTVLTLTWKNESGETRTQNVTIAKGNDGISITEAKVDENNHLIITYSDGTELDAGKIDTTEGLSQDLTALVAIGTVTSGKKYPKGTLLETILRDILIKTEAPTVSVGITPSKTVYDVVEERLPTITIKAIVSKKTYPISSIEFYVGDTKIESITTEVSSGGVFNYEYTPATETKTNTSFKVVVTDINGNKGSNLVNVYFVGSSYYGIIDPEIGTPTEIQIKTLSKDLKTTKGFVYKNIVCDYNKVCYAYPKSFGELASIKDVENNINYTNSFSRTTVQIDGIDYYCYTLNEPTGADGVNVTFA